MKINEPGRTTNGSAKAGIIVRNDVTQPGSSPGYAAHRHPAGGGFEWLRDTDGNGQLDASTGAARRLPGLGAARARRRHVLGYWSNDGASFSRSATR